MKIAAIAVLSVLIIFLGIQVFSFVKQSNQLSSDYASVQDRLAKAKTDAANLEEEKQYLANPVNLEKELRSRFNYVNPGEKMVIIVPLGTSTPNATSVSD
ncbi:MAG: septum formation initiator family protein [Candidatus Pacebacteria bacterium]|nr:septum formation initiator family protein [Candidatus Paceibacterota bacterium]